jgi:hypothetical protein
LDEVVEKKHSNGNLKNKRGETEVNIYSDSISSIKMTIEDFLRKITLPKRYFSVNFVITEKFDEEKESFFENFDYVMATNFLNQRA